MGWRANDLSTRGIPLAFGKPTAYATGGTQDIVYEGFTLGQGGNGRLHRLEWTSSGWHYRGDFTDPNSTGAPAAYQFTDLTSYYFAAQNTQHIEYMAADGHIYELYLDADGWHVNDLWSSGHATVPALAGPSGFAAGGLQQVFYRGTDSHVQELAWDIAGWHAHDLTTQAGGPLVLASGPATYAFDGQSTQHVVYVASEQITGGHVHELWRDSHGQWHDGGNLTAITGAPTLATGQPSGYAFEEQFTQHVFYRGVDGNIHELRWGTDTGGWHYWGNVTTQTGAPRAAGDPRGYVFVPQSTQHVVYQGIDSHIHELWWDGSWHHNDLTIRTGAPPTGTDPVGYVFGYLRDTQHVIYNTTDHHIVELAWDALATKPQFLADVTGDGRADIVAFGDEGVWVARGKGDGTFDFPQNPIADFGFVAGGWRVDRHVRLIADVTGDGLADIVGFGEDGVYVARAAGGGAFNPVQFVIGDFGYTSGWRVDRHPRVLAKLRNNGRADIIGFGDAGVYVALSNGDGTFTFTAVPVVADFGYNAGGWRVDRHPRFVADLRGIGTADIVGFGDAGVWVALGDGAGGFGQPQLVVENFGYDQGWRVDRHPRFLADLSGRGLLDIVGFGDAGVWVARAAGGGAFSPPQLVIADFGYNAGGWRVERHPRFVADVSGDGRADIVGFGDAGAYVARSKTDGSFDYSPVPVLADFGYNAGGWRVDRNPRFLADLRGNGRADIVGFGNVGVRTALSNLGGTFGPTQLAAPDFGRDDGRSW